MDSREQRFSLANAAYAAGVDWTRLKNWLDRGLITLDGAMPDPGKHRRFSFIDILRIAFIGRLCRFGVGPEEASMIVENLLGKDGGFILFKREKKPAPELLVNYFRWGVITVWFDETEGRFEWNRVQRVAVPAGADAAQDACIVLSLGQITQAALEKAKEVSAE